MRVFLTPRPPSMIFHIKLRPKETCLNELAYVYRLKAEYEGTLEEAQISRLKEGDERLGVLTLWLGSHSRYLEAKDDYERNVTEEQIREEHLGALEAADPGRLHAEELRKAIKKIPVR